MLYVLDDYGGDDGDAFPNQKTLARNVGIGVRQLRNVLRGLESAGLIERSREGRAGNHYRIVWQRLDEKRHSTAAVNESRPATRDRSNRQPTASAQRQSVAGRTSHHENSKRKSHGHWLQNSEKGWLGNLEPEHLRDPVNIERIYERAVSHGIIMHDDANRVRFHAIAVYAVRKAKNPGATFRKAVEGQHWDWATDDDTEQARLRVGRLSSAGRSPGDAVTALAGKLTLPNGVAERVPE